MVFRKKVRHWLATQNSADKITRNIKLHHNFLLEVIFLLVSDEKFSFFFHFNKCITFISKTIFAEKKTKYSLCTLITTN